MTMEFKTGFTSSVNYALHGTIFALNLWILVTMGWSFSVQDDIYDDGIGILSPMITLICTSCTSLYTLAHLIVSYQGNPVPPLTRILVDSLAAFPAYAASIVISFILIPASDGSCSSSISLSKCQQIWGTVHVFHILTILALLISCTLIIIDFSFAVKHHNVLKKISPPASNVNAPALTPRVNYAIHGSIFALTLWIVGSMTWSLVMQSELSEVGFLLPIIAMSCISVVLLYTIVLLILSFTGAGVPALSRIMVDSLLCFPAYAITFAFAFVVRESETFDLSAACVSDRCKRISKQIMALQYLVIIMVIISSVLTMIDFSLSNKSLNRQNDAWRRVQTLHDDNKSESKV